MSGLHRMLTGMMEYARLLVAVADLVLTYEDPDELEAAVARLYPGSPQAQAMLHGLVFAETEFGRRQVEQLRDKYAWDLRVTA